MMDNLRQILIIFLAFTGTILGQQTTKSSKAIARNPISTDANILEEAIDPIICANVLADRCSIGLSLLSPNTFSCTPGTN